MPFPTISPASVMMAGLTLGLVGTGCHSLGPPIREGEPVQGAPGNVLNLDQGWRRKEQELFYFTSQGSQLLPYDWFLVLEQAGNTNLFRADENLERQRWLVSRPTRLNPDGLPVGFVKDVDRRSRRAYVGLTCAACHTGEIQYRGTGLRIDGGPTMADADGFLNELSQSVSATLADGAKFDRFAHAVLGRKFSPGRELELRRELEQSATYLTGRIQRNAPHAPYGHARLDAFGNILNEVLAYALDLPANARPADAPVSYPFIWDTPQADRVQWNGVAENNPPDVPAGLGHLLGPLGRNVGEVLGVFGRFKVEPTGPLDGYPSSVKIKELGRLEGWVADLWSPRWPASVLPPLDPVRIKRGEEIYHRRSGGPACVTCHEEIQRNDPNRRPRVTMVPVDVVGTDRAMAYNFTNRIALTGRLEGKKVSSLAGDNVFGATAAGGDILGNVGTGVILGQVGPTGEYIAVNAIKETFEGRPPPHQARPASLYAYKARPLNGIWATAPYLHNGSVPNLREMLTPPAQRSTSFAVGSREFDPVHVGFDTTATGPATTILDTRLPGNSNAGHVWGTDLPEEDKLDLMEYLKSL